MKTYEVKSKVYVVPSKLPLIGYLIVNLLILFMMIWCIIDIIRGGVETKHILLIFLSLASMFAMRLTNFYRAHYEKSPARITIGNGVKLEFPKHGRIISFADREIYSLEYSDRLNCLRLVGNYVFDSSGKKEFANGREYLFYVSTAELGLFMSDLETAVGKKIVFVDRK